MKLFVLHFPGKYAARQRNLLHILIAIVTFFFFLLTHEEPHTGREVYQEFQPNDDLFCRCGAKGCSDHRFRAPPLPNY